MSQSAKPICPGYNLVSDPVEAPSVKFVASRLAEIESDNSVAVNPALGVTLNGWALMACIERGGEAIAVFEQVAQQEGHFAFVSATGRVRMSPKSLEPTSEGDAGLKFHEVESWYRGHRKEDVLPDRRDILREELLATGTDPTPADVAACYPAARHAFFEGHLRPHTFVGTGISDDVVPLYYQDVTMVSRVPISVIAPGSELAMAEGDIWEGLVGGWPPIVRIVYPIASDESWEVVTFASSTTANSVRQPAWYRAVHLRQGKVVDANYIDSFLPFPRRGERLCERFYQELLATLEYWDQETGGGMTISGWDEFANRSRHAFAREMITRRGVHPKYGIADQAYAGAEHDGFQDILVSSVLACLEWGYFGRARAYLDDYFTNFVRPDGTLHYRGPEMGKYGVSLTCLGLYYAYTEDPSLLQVHRSKIAATIDMLLARWRKAREREPSDPAFGMVAGYHEADINFLTPNVYELDYDRPYLSNTGEVWRGLRDISSAYIAIAERGSDQALLERGHLLRDLASQIFEDARNGVERSWITKNGETGLPIIAGDSTFYWEHPYRARPESYDENRVWSELYFGGAATKGTVKRIWDIAGDRGHTTLGVFNNRKSMVGFLVWEEIAGLIQHDMIPEALLTFYAQAFHAHSRGTWTAIECVDLDRARGAHSPYCLPAQMTVPIALKWLLVYDDPVTGTVTLGRGIPRDRLVHGCSIGVTDAPTRWGKVGYSLISHINDGVVTAHVTMPERRGANLTLAIRVPKPWHLVAVRCVNRLGVDLLFDQGGVVLLYDLSGNVDLETRWETDLG